MYLFFRAGVTIINIKIIGKGGHSSYPELVVDPIKPASKIYVDLDDYSLKLRKTEKILLKICKF
jgi:metal-dependent amidase/aminoacylase/carboxypeptidase family protein